MINIHNRSSVPHDNTSVDTIVKVDGDDVYLKLKPINRTNKILIIGDEMFQLDNNVELIDRDIVFSPTYGNYVICRKDSVQLETLSLGRGRYPYTFTREYEAVKHFDIFNDVMKKMASAKNGLEPPKHTFGVEFETSSGYLPQEECFNTGLIPLRDGSIGACEYSTVVMKGCGGLDLLRTQAETLKKYTVFDKECALHMHLGGFPLSSKAIFVLYVICFYLERDMYYNMLPRLSFRTGEYKANGKDYCLKLPEFHSFLDLYKFFVGRDYGGSLSQPHPQDPDRDHKWQIHNRYYGLNLINMLCYKSPKTVEFRFLRPTFNWKKLFFWVYFFDMIVCLAETLSTKLSNKEFTYIFDYVMKYMSKTNIHSIIWDYTSRTSLREFLSGMMLVNTAVIDSQTAVNDYYGKRIDIEDVIINRWFYESGIDLEK